VDRAAKEALVATLNQTFQDAAIVVVTRQSGMSVVESNDLRTRVREAGAGYKVTKNRLTRLALDGTRYEGLKDLFTGPTAIAWSEDPVAAAKAVVNYAKDNSKLEIVGGAFGEQVLDVQGVEAMAKLPSLDELRGKIVGLLQAPAGKLASVTQAPAGQLARVFGAYGSKEEAA
jgi:large subunit ribosomal protein L10